MNRKLNKPPLCLSTYRASSSTVERRSGSAEASGSNPDASIEVFGKMFDVKGMWSVALRHAAISID